MKISHFEIPIFDFSLYILKDIALKDKKKYLDFLTKHDVSEEIISNEEDLIDCDPKNGGATLSCKGNKTIIVVLYECENSKELKKTYYHELWHVVNSITKCCHIEDEETSAYIYGYLTTLYSI